MDIIIKNNIHDVFQKFEELEVGKILFLQMDDNRKMLIFKDYEEVDRFVLFSKNRVHVIDEDNVYDILNSETNIIVNFGLFDEDELTLIIE